MKPKHNGAPERNGADARLFLGTDGGATMSKVGAVRADGTPLSMELLQAPTNGALGPAAVVEGWTAAASAFLREHALDWNAVGGVGLAIPGPFQRYGVFDRTANLPPEFAGFDVHAAYSAALARAAGREIPLVVGNDGNMGGVAEARHALAVDGDGAAGGSASQAGSVLMLDPGSGLGCAYVDASGRALDGDTLAGMEAAHMSAPLHLLDVPAYPCGCGRTWGCVEVYTSLSGLPYLLEAALSRHPTHPLASSPLSPKQRAFTLRGLAQNGDALALEIFDFQAKALGLHIASLAMVLDPAIVVIGGGLMDPEATTAEFRDRYLGIVRESARPHLWPAQRERMRIVAAALGELSQAIGAALTALYLWQEQLG